MSDTPINSFAVEAALCHPLPEAATLEGSQDQTKVCAALCAAQAEMPGVGFDSTNPMFRSKYASLGAIISVSQPILQKHGLAILQVPSCTAQNMGRMKYDPDDESEVEKIQGQVSLNTKIIHNSGQWLDGGTLSLPIQNQRGNSISQLAGIVITYLRRYSWTSVLGMYADEDNDGNEPPPPTAAKTDSDKADAATRLRALNRLEAAPGQRYREMFTAFLKHRKWIPANGIAEGWDLAHVPVTVSGLKALAAEVTQWDTDRHQPDEGVTP